MRCSYEAFYLIVTTSVVTILTMLMIIVNGCDSDKDLTKNLTNYPNGYVTSSSTTSSNILREKVKVALIDSGVDKSFLKSGVSIEHISFIEEELGTDILGHGTAIAGIWYGNEKIAGTASFIELIDIKVIDQYGNAEIGDVIEGIEYAIDQNVDVINMSFGFDKDNNELREAITKAIEANIIVVAAAGNTASNQSQYPAQYPEVLSISAIDEDLELYIYASTGKVDFVAPGVKIPIVNVVYNQNEVDGTSFATAYVTAVVSHFISLNMKKEEVLEELYKNSYEIGSTGYRLIKIE